MSTDHILQFAETLQTASIKRHPSPTHDINPSTAASRKEPITLETHPDLDDVLSEADNADEDEIPESVLRPLPRKPQLPPLPDLRFEQSYLASIKNADTWQKVAFISIRDQVFMPLAQGMVWTLVVAGWRAFNQASHFSGQSVGAKIRRWWWNTNNWAIPTGRGSKLGDRKLAADVQEYYEAEFASGGSD